MENDNNETEIKQETQPAANDDASHDDRDIAGKPFRFAPQIEDAFRKAGLPVHEFEEEEIVASRFDRFVMLAGSLFHRARQAVSGVFEVRIGGLSFRGELSDLRPKVISPLPPRQMRRWLVGFGPAEIPAHSTITVQVQPQVLFRGEKIINTGDVDNLYIQGLFVGNRPQLPTFASTIALATFGPDVTDNELMMDTCDPALFITFQIQNTSDQPRMFACSIVGKSVP